MSFNIQQYRYISGSKDDAFMSMITDVQLTQISSFYYDEAYLCANTLKLNNAEFQEDTYYFIHAKIKSRQDENTVFVYLIDSKTFVPYGTFSGQFIGSFKANNTWNDLSFAFTPILNKFDTVLFITGTVGVCDDIIIQELSKFNNIKASLMGISGDITRLGVQSTPNFSICLNGQPIKVGKSGLFEIDNKFMSINAVSALAIAEEDETVSKTAYFPYGETCTFTTLEELENYIDTETTPYHGSVEIVNTPKIRKIDTFILDCVYEEEDV